MLLRLLTGRPWLAVLIATATPVALTSGGFTDPRVQVPFAMLSFAIPSLLLTHYGLLAGVSALYVDMMSVVIVGLDFSSFFSRTMVAGVLLLALPALLGFYATVAGRSLVARRFELADN